MLCNDVLLRARHGIMMLPPHFRGTATGMLQCLRRYKADVEYLDQKRYDSAARRARAQNKRCAARARAEQAVQGTTQREAPPPRAAHRRGNDDEHAMVLAVDGCGDDEPRALTAT